MKFISLKWKISGILVLSNLILGMILVIIVNRTVSASLSKELIERGRTIALNLAQASIEQIMTEDRVGLRQLITANQNFESVDYILVQKSDGLIIADTFNGQVPVELVQSASPTAEKLTNDSLISMAERGLSSYDIWAAVEDGYYGHIRVGMKEDYVKQSVRRTNLIVIITITGITILGIIIVLTFASRMINPIVFLTQRADEISRGELDEKIDLHTNDEIEQLGQALDRLRESVKIALERLKKHQTLRV